MSDSLDQFRISEKELAEISTKTQKLRVRKLEQERKDLAEDLAEEQAILTNSKKYT